MGCTISTVIDFNLARVYFDARWYRANYRDVLPDDLADPFLHYIKSGWKKFFDPNPFFDTDWYLNEYRESIPSEMNPLIHYVLSGNQLGARPSLFFDSNWYLDKNPDVKSSGMNPLHHYLEHGKNEGRLPLDSSIVQKVENVLCRESLSDFHHAPISKVKKIAILIPVHNKWHLTEICLRSLFGSNEIRDAEIFVVNDASTDETCEGLERFNSINVINTDENLGFTRAVNTGFKHIVAAGFEYIYLLNNDTFVLPGFLSCALELIQSKKKIAMVGSKLLYLDGTLQECGGIIWNDGTGANFGRNTNSNEAIYDFSRQVDYCSGAAILIDSKALEEVGYFDELFAPAYYEDTDLAFKFRHIEREVWVSSGSEIVHFEGGSHGTDINFGIKKSQEVNRLKFAEKWSLVLEDHLSSSPKNLLPGAFRLTAKSSRAIIWVDDRYPDPSRDSGSVRTAALLEIAKSEKSLIVFVATCDDWEGETGNSLRNLGQLAARNFRDAKVFLNNLNLDLWFIWVSRVTSAVEIIGDLYRHNPETPLIFDTVDLHFLRLERELEQGNSRVDVAQVALVKEQELAVMKYAKKTIVVSSFEQKYLEEKFKIYGTNMISNVHRITTELPQYEFTNGVVFIGGYDHWPNVQGIIWFVNEVWPLVDIEVRSHGLTIAGSNAPVEVLSLKQKNIDVVGWVEDSEHLVRSNRISIAPLLSGAGVKGKIGESLSQGIPVIGTSIATEGMGFINNQHGIVANSPIEFAQSLNSLYHSVHEWNLFQQSGLDLVRDNFSINVVRTQFIDLVRSI